jgi:heme exporter protein C
MLIPLLTMSAGFMCYFAAVLLTRVRGELLARESQARWVKEIT